MTRILWLAVLCSFISACGSLQNNNSATHAAVCKELKRRIIFNGATGNNTQATQQRAQIATLNQNYRDQGCQ